MTTDTSTQPEQDRPPIEEVLSGLWERGERPHEVLRSAIAERGLASKLESLEHDIRMAQLQGAALKGRARQESLQLMQAWLVERNRYLAEVIALIMRRVRTGQYVLISRRGSRLELVKVDGLRVDFEEDRFDLARRTATDVRMVETRHARVFHLPLLEGCATYDGLRNSYRRYEASLPPRPPPASMVQPSRLQLRQQQSLLVALREAVAAPAKRGKRRPPDESDLDKPMQERRFGPPPRLPRYEALMRERAEAQTLEGDLTAEVRALRRIARGWEAKHRLSHKRLLNGLGRLYRDLSPESASQEIDGKMTRGQDTG